MKEWFTAAELAGLDLPDVPGTKRGVNLLATKSGWRDARDMAGAPLCRPRGSGLEYSYRVLPTRAQTELQKRAIATRKAAPAGTAGARKDERETRNPEAWDWFDRLPEARKAKARHRLAALDAVAALRRGGVLVNDAVHTVATECRVGASTLYAWQDLVAGLDRADWLPALAPRHAGRQTTVECDPRAWAFVKADYLRLSRPSFETCYERLTLAAAEQGWSVPSARTLRRRIEREIPAPVATLLRYGTDALKRMYPPQERDRTMFHALEAVNADGHKWDVFVRWPDGEIGRPMMVAIQDLYSNKILGWRVDRSENSDAVRLAFGDVFRQYGIPDRAWLDNGRGFAAKWITGGTPNRYRFKVKPEEPSGILTALGVEVHWTKPYSGQSKPIERAFKDLCDSVAKHPAFEGAYTGNRPDAKPENYGSRAVPIADFLAVVGQGIRLHNARIGRNTRVCRRELSFDQAFERSYAQAVIRKAGPEQLRLCLLAAESVRASRESGALQLLGNRYWSESLHRHIGEALTVRFDPDKLHDGVHVYRLDGSYVGFADCLEAAGFADTGKARDHARKFGAFKRATREAARLESQMTLDQLVSLLPNIDEPDKPETKLVRMVNGGAVALPAPAVDPDAMTADEVDRAFGAGLQLLQGGIDDD